MQPKDIVTNLVRVGHMYRMSPKDLSILTGYSVRQFARWRRHTGPITLHQVNDWANALGFELTLRKQKVVSDDAASPLRTRK